MLCGRPVNLNGSSLKNAGCISENGGLETGFRNVTPSTLSIMSLELTIGSF